MPFNIAKIETMQTGDIEHLSTTIYFNTCRNRCVYCHNPELRDGKIGREWTLKEVVSACTDEWVCLIGGDPIHTLTVEELMNLSITLHNLGKKVVIFTSELQPLLINLFDHYHYHVVNKIPWDFKISDKNKKVLSVSYVSYNDFNINLFADWMKDVDVYVREAIGYEEFSHVKRDSDSLKELGFNKIYSDGEQIVIH